MARRSVAFGAVEDLSLGLVDGQLPQAPALVDVFVASQRPKKGEAERELVGGRPDPTADVLLGSHVTRRPHHQPCFSQPLRGQRLRVRHRIHRDARAAQSLAVDQGQAKVQDLDRPVITHHHVVGLEVAVDQPLRVGGCEAPSGKRERVNDLRDAPLFMKPSGQGLARDQLHHDERGGPIVLIGAHVVDTHDVRMGELGERLRLAEEACGRMV